MTGNRFRKKEDERKETDEKESGHLAVAAAVAVTEKLNWMDSCSSLSLKESERMEKRRGQHTSIIIQQDGNDHVYLQKSYETVLLGTVAHSHITLMMWQT